MVRWEQYKYITVNGYPPQLYDLHADPNETVNVAGRAEYSSAEAQLRVFAEKDWNGPAIKKAVMADQQDHLMLRSVKGDGIKPDWNYEPVETGTYNPLSDFADRRTQTLVPERTFGLRRLDAAFSPPPFTMPGIGKAAQRRLGTMLRMKTKAASSRRSPRRCAHFQPSEWAHF